MLIPREANKLRLYIELGLENGLIDTATGRVAAQNMDAKRLLDVCDFLSPRTRVRLTWAFF
jgi:hypothetical protein